jgi:murein L,D-transpeptidase YcbB/YkuD
MLLGDDGGEWTPDKIAETLASKKSKQANFVKPLPVYIVYFSVAANTDGSIVNYDDMYKRDAKVIAALLDVDGKAPDKKPVEKVATKS